MTDVVVKGNESIDTALERVAHKGVLAMEAFLDLRSRTKATGGEFQQKLSYAKVGAVAVGRYVGHEARKNNTRAIALAERRMLPPAKK